MKFKYKKYSYGVLRPVVPIKVIYANRWITNEVLVDSGSDGCLFDAEIGNILGIKLEQGKKAYVSGVTGKRESYYIHPVNIEVGNSKHKILAGFLPNIGKYGYGVVGQQGFFEIFKVKFDLLKETVELQLRK